jgi:hypothetical protein
VQKTIVHMKIMKIKWSCIWNSWKENNCAHENRKKKIVKRKQLCTWKS